MTRVVLDGCTGHGQGSDMGERIQIGGAVAVANPKTLLAGSLKAGIIAFTFSTQSISPLEAGTIPVNGKAVVRRNGFVFRTALIFLAVVPVFVVTRASPRFRVAEWAAKFLTDTVFIPVKNFPVLSHGKASLTDDTARGQLIRVFGIAFV